MKRHRTRAGISWSLVAGASLHWASIIYTGVDLSGAAGAVADCFPRLNIPFVAVLAMFATLFSHALEQERGRRAAGIASVVGGAVALLTALVPGLRLARATPAGSVAFQLAIAANVGVLVLLWGFAFASLDKKTAGMNAALTALGSLALAPCLLLLTQGLGWNASAPGLVARLVSAGILLSGHVRFTCTRRSLETSAAKPLARFYLSRLVLGFGIGALYGSALASEPSLPLAAVGAALAAGALAAVSPKTKESVYGFLPVLPLALAGLAFLPFVGAGSGNLAALASTVLWLCWIFTSSFQLSGLKETFGVDEVRLSTSEKAALMVGWVAGLATNGALTGLAALEPLACVVAYAAVLWATFASFRTVYNRREDEFIERLEGERSEQNERVYGAISDRFGLTPREREVMAMLAQGFTRPYICEALAISDGTARAHASHVYQKLGVHKKDEFLQLVHTVEREIGAR